LEQQGWLCAEWRKSETGRDAKYYALTRAGRAQLEKELAQWERLSNAVGLVIRIAEECRKECGLVCFLRPARWLASATASATA
jgi:DNA-binding PadR family transcriptional regulator